jgi:hypothetical protein
MSFPELLDAVKALPYGDKLQLIQAIQADMAQTPEEVLCEKLGIQPGHTFEVWVPELSVNALEAAQRALQLGENGA